MRKMPTWHCHRLDTTVEEHCVPKQLSFATKTSQKRRCLKPMKQEMDVEKFPTHHFFMSNHSYLTWNSRKQLPWRIFLLKKSLKDGAFSHGLGLKNGLTTKAKRKERRHSSQLYSSRICCVQCVPIFPISRTFKNAALLHPPSSSTQTNEKAFLSFFCYCICDKKRREQKRLF